MQACAVSVDFLGFRAPTETRLVICQTPLAICGHSCPSTLLAASALAVSLDEASAGGRFNVAASLLPTTGYLSPRDLCPCGGTLGGVSRLQASAAHASNIQETRQGQAFNFTSEWKLFPCVQRVKHSCWRLLLQPEACPKTCPFDQIH